jgi:hypothetical protein
MKILFNNQQLYDYLMSLNSGLGKRGLQELSDSVLFASRHASGMGESRIALRRVLREGRAALTSQEQDDIRNVLEQLDAALDRR